MAKSLLPTFGMQSNRIMLSNKHYHTLELPEESMGVIIHALDVLEIAFSAEHQYRAAIIRARDLVRTELNAPLKPTDPR